MSERRLKVLSIAHTAVTRAAGRLRYDPLADDPDLDVHLVVPDHFRQFGRRIEADPVTGDRIPVHILPIVFDHAGPMSWYAHLYRGLGRLVSELKPDVIHLWEEPWSLVALQACMRRKDAAYVLEVDQNILKRLPPPFQQIRRGILSRTDHILSRSGDATDVVRACGYAGPVSPIGYGVDQETFFPRHEGQSRPAGPLRFGYVGRLVEEKGIQDVLAAMAKTSAPVTLQLLGEGPYEAELRAMTARLGLADRVSFRGWAAPVVVADFIRGLDALLLVTHTTPVVKEQFGRVIIEAQGCGVPVIGARSGAIADVVGDGGWIVPERDPGALAHLFDALSAALAGNPELFAEKRRMALANVEARFTYSAIAGQLADAWRAAARAKGII